MRRAASLLALVLVGCQTVDPTVFDDRLRAATLDAIFDEVERLHGGVFDGSLETGDWRASHRTAGMAATDPEEFYRRLAHVLLDLHDPHTRLRVPPSQRDIQSWQPVRFHWVRVGDRVYVAFPSGRLDEARDARWQDAILPLSERLRDSIDPSPLSWYPICGADGRAVREPFEVAQLVMGPSLQPLRLEVEVDGERRAVDVPRNGRRVRAGRFVFLETPESIVEGLEGASEPSLHGSNTPELPVPPGPRFQAGRPIVEPPPEWSLRSADVEAWRLGQAGYLRIGSFRSHDDADHTIGEDFHDRVDDAMVGLDGARDLILDLQGNPGGRWDHAAYVLAFLLPDRQVMPYEVHDRDEWLGGLWTVRTIHQFLRPDIDPIQFDRIAILIDQRTGSAAEVVAASLEPLSHVTLVGERSLGAEYAIYEFQAPDGSLIQFGKAGGMTPPSRNFQSRGLSADIEVSWSLEELETLGLEEARSLRETRVLRAALEELGHAPDRWLPRR